MHRTLYILLPLAAVVGCRSYPSSCAVRNAEAQVLAIAAVTASERQLPVPEETSLPNEPLSLDALWALAIQRNPLLREAASDVEAAHGRWIQAGKYPNPSIAYDESKLGDPRNAAGKLTLALQQEFLTAQKRPLDMRIAARGTDVACLALLARKFDVLARIRRAYYDYLALAYVAQVNDEVAASLEQDTEVIRKQVEEVKSRPYTDLIRLRALLEDARIGQIRSQVNLSAAWRQLAAEVGVPDLAAPCASGELPDHAPSWESPAVVQRVLAASTELRQLSAQVGVARLQVSRAQAQAVPNVTVGAGYTRDFTDQFPGGAVLNVEMPLPLWDRREGQIYEAQARLSQAQAAVRTASMRLERDTADAWSRYRGALRQEQQLTEEVLPRLKQSLDEVRKGYLAGAAQLAFADVILAEQSYNAARLRLADTRRELWRAVADLEGLMQLDVGEEHGASNPPQ